MHRVWTVNEIVVTDRIITECLKEFQRWIDAASKDGSSDEVKALQELSDADRVSAVMRDFVYDGFRTLCSGGSK